jgi:hypothetical protein
MLVAYDGDRPLAQQPYFEALLEDGSAAGYCSKRTSAINATSVPGWTVDARGEYILRRDLIEGGVKFGRLAAPRQGEGGGAFVLSSWRDDSTLGCRSEITTYGPAADLPQGRDLWIAGRYFLDFAQGPNEWVTILQIKPAPSTSPILALSVYGSRWNVARAYNPADGLADNYAGDRVVTALPDRSAERYMRRWITVAIRANIDPLNLGGGGYAVWIDDEQIASYSGPVGFGGLTVAGGRRLNNARWGNYPNPPGPGAWQGHRRDVLISRCCVALDTGYTLQQVQAAMRPAAA